MKNLLLTIAFILIATTGFAQDEAFRNDVKKLIEMTGSASQIDIAKKQVIGMVPAEKQKEFLVEFEASLKPVFEAMENFYMKEYSHDEIKEIIKFYETPIGKKMSAKAGPLTEATIEATQNWSMELQSMLMKYMQ